MKERNIKAEIKEKLHDPILSDNLARFAKQYPQARLKAYANVDDIDELRNELRDMKKQTVAHIEEVADKFQASLEERGAKVFRAKDGDELKAQLLQICKENNIHRIVKSKSMATEEIHLNHFLEQQGLRVKETDLGEWMLSVAGQKPSHMVMPAIHLNRKQCAKFFSDELKEDIPSDIPYMIQIARKVLREEFLKADMGITGANFGIAENGAIGLVTNEGNARIVTTIPPVHVIIIGYEKLIPKISDAAKIMRLLPRNGTGQRMVSYLTLIDGPTPIIHEKEGKLVEENKKVYVILLDNGRLKAAHDDKLKEVYQCVRCSSCLNVCPIWSTVGGHVYGYIYSGGIGAILTGLLNGMDNFSQFSDLCIGCRRCTTICPGKIDIPGFSMYKEMNKLDDTVNNEGKIKITYHDSCHMKRGLNIYKEPRVLLKNTKKYNFLEMQGCDQCCGMAGAFGMKYKDISLRLLSRKLENIKDSQADIVAVACPACMMQIGGGLDKQMPNVKVKHIADILAEEL